jgi:hypothetical protein
MTEKPIACPYCKKKFSDAGAQYSHWKDRHRNRTMPPEAKALRVSMTAPTPDQINPVA